MQKQNPLTVKAKALTALARHTFNANRFLFVEGQGGVGKTSILVNETAPALGREPWLVNLSGQGPQECLGYGIPQKNGDMLFSAPEIWPTEKRVGDKPVLLILDEFTNYDSQVQALLRGLFPASGFRHVGPHKLGSNVAVAITGNRRDHGNRGKVEDAPFTERSVKVCLEADLDSWFDWLEKAHPGLDSHVPAFLKFGTTTGDGLDHFCPPVKLPYDGTPHPCPRTWEAVVLSEGLRQSLDTEDNEAYRAILRGSIGPDSAQAFLGFLAHVDSLPDIPAIKEKGGKIDPIDSAEKQFALASAICTTAARGIDDLGAAVHKGEFDWVVECLTRLRGDIREFAATSMIRRGIPLHEHDRVDELIDLD